MWNDFLVEFDCVDICITLEASCFLLCIFMRAWKYMIAFIDPRICPRRSATLSFDRSSSK